MAAALKRKRSSDAVSECTHTTECTDASQGVVLDERSQQLADKRAQHAAERLELEQQVQQLDEQRQHVAAQLEQLEGCEGGDTLGVSDLKQQLQAYEEQHQQATSRLADLDRQFESAVASILGITPEGQPQQLAAALQEQQQLQEVQVQQLAVEQQLGGRDFSVTSDSSKHKSKKARLEKMSSVWDWLQGGDGGGGGGAGAVPEQQGAAEQQQVQQQPLSVPGSSSEPQPQAGEDKPQQQAQEQGQQSAQLQQPQQQEPPLQTAA